MLDPNLKIPKKKTNRFAYLYILWTKKAKQSGVTVEELSQNVKERFSLESKNDMSEDQLSQITKELESELNN